MEEDVYYLTKYFLSKELNTKMKERCQKIIEIIKNPKENATLVLGAGINASSGIPTWNSLLARLFELRASMSIKNLEHGICFTLSSEEYYKSKMVFSEEDVLEVAEYIAVNSDSPIRREKELTLLVKAALSSNDLDFKNNPDITKHYLCERTLGAVARLADRFFQHKMEGNVMQNRSVITFNYDNLLEYFLDEVLRTNVQAVFKKREIHNEQVPCLHVYHPHGYLPLAPTKYDPEKATGISSNIILSESSYYNLERYIYSWENFILVRALQDSTCIFCGFSGNDYNFKRIVKGFPESADRIESDTGGYHFILFPINYIIDSVCDNKNQKLSELECGRLRSSLSSISEEDIYRISRYLDMKERYWFGKGFVPIWTTYHNNPKYDDLHHLLDYLSLIIELSPYEN